MGWRAPFLGVSLAVFLFSLVGVPPTAGFTGKFQLFMGVVRTAQASAPGLLQTLLFVMAGVALINTAVSAYYYTKILRNMYLRDIEEGGERVHVPILGSLTVAALLIMTIYLFVDADEILKSTLELKLYTGV
jgi:NADH-quinone oxidoreductase subunit N